VQHTTAVPQHWAQEINDNTPQPDGIQCVTCHDRIILKWSQQTRTKTVHIDPHSNNVATLWSVGGMNAFEASMALANVTNVLLDTEVQPHQPSPQKDKDQYQTDENTYRDANDVTKLPSKLVPTYDEDFHYSIKSFRHIGNEDMVIEGEDYEGRLSDQSPSTELMHWHQRFGHISMARLQRLASEGVLPTRLAKCAIPICPSCLFGKMTRRPWRVKSDHSTLSATVKLPGEMVSVDQLISTVPGLIAQIKGIPTRQRYYVATVFVNHASDYTFVHFQTDTGSAETLTAKHEFERHASGVGLNIKKYHADNGRFI
jgi:GAG-pre-integrase domain